MTASVRTLLVDLDGTLVDADEILVRLEFTAGVLRQFARRGKGGYLRAFRALAGVRRQVEKGARELVNGERAARAFGGALGIDPSLAGRELEESVLAAFATLGRHFRPVPGAGEFIAWAGGRFSLVLATNPVWPLEVVTHRVRWAGIEPGVFRSITHAGRMHSCKPSVAYYREVLEQEGLRPSECLMVGNDPRKELPAAQAGIPVFILSDSARAVEIPSARGAAPCWSGSYGALRALLEAR